MLKNTFFFLSLIIVTTNFYAQQTADYTSKLVDYNTAFHLYNNHQYLAAQSLFTDIINTSGDENIKSKSAYYSAISAVQLNQKNADQLIKLFLNEYPTSVNQKSAYLNLANYYFLNENYIDALNWYVMVDEQSLSTAEKKSFNFNKGYSFFQNKQYDEAKICFHKSLDSSNDLEARYYLGYIAYEEDDYTKASSMFEEVKNEQRYLKEISYYQADINFKLGDFQKAIDVALKQYESSNPREKSELSKIIGESYFNLENYKEALGYLKNYQGKKGKWNNTDYYQLGYVFFKQQDYQNAISEFSKIIDGNDATAQNAFYHLANSYLKIEQKQQALNAFKSASEMNFNAEIKENAFLNYAKLSYQIGNSYQNIFEVLLSFIENYPNNKNNNELKELLIDSYISSKNYQLAIDFLENNISFENKSAYQKVCFYRGLELFNEGRYSAAIQVFEKSLEEPSDSIFKARAIYWKAECDYQLLNFNASLTSYKQFLQLPNSSKTSEINTIYYNVGYTNFKLKKYQDAINQFNRFVSSATLNLNQKRDAFVRIGDSYFMLSDYWSALENYNKAIEDGALDQDYVYFQKAISYGFVDRILKKIEGLKVVINKFSKSIYKDDALYELGNTYVSQENYQDAMVSYNTIIKDLPNSSYVSKSLLKKALILENTGKSKEAISIFKRVANDFPSSQEALQAVSSAKIIYIELGRVDDYATWVDRLDFVNIENSEIDDATFKAAEITYLENKTDLAISRFEKYIFKFPKGKHALKTHFYLAQLYFFEQNNENAILQYQFVLDSDRNDFTEQALAKISQLYLEKKDYKSSLPYLIRLEKEADFLQNIIFAQSNMMKAYFELKTYNKAVIFAEKVLLNEKIESTIKSDAHIIIARSAIKTGDQNKAREAYLEVLTSASGKLAAEAWYYDAYFKHQAQQYKSSNSSIQKLAKEYPGFKYFGAKGLLLMAKNFYQLNDAFQATYILESIINNFTEYPEIIEEATSDLASIKMEESKTNESIKIDNKN
jgi:tetratricopeptide (TPR) repeat protein